jgi:transposase
MINLRYVALTEDPKLTALREARCLNPHPGAVTDEVFTSQEFFDARDAVQVKYEMVRRVRVDRMSVSAAAETFGYSRPSFYQAAAALDGQGLDGLAASKPGPRGGQKITAEVCALAQTQLDADPGLRPGDLVTPIAEQFGVRVHPRSIERALARHRKQSPSP